MRILDLEERILLGETFLNNVLIVMCIEISSLLTNFQLCPLFQPEEKYLSTVPNNKSTIFYRGKYYMNKKLDVFKLI